MRSMDNFQHLLDILPTTVNGIILCQGNLTLMTDDLPTVIRHFGNQKKNIFCSSTRCHWTTRKISRDFSRRRKN